MVRPRTSFRPDARLAPVIPDFATGSLSDRPKDGSTPPKGGR